jgi:hypothetical protein
MPPEQSYNLGMNDGRGGVEGVLGGIDAVARLIGAILVLVIAVAAIFAGGAAGWALGGCLLAVLAFVGRRKYVRLVRPDESDD